MAKRGLQEIGEVAKELRAKMEANGIKFPEAGAEVKPIRPAYSGYCRQGWDCQWCGGSGYYQLDVEPGHPQFGKLQRCPNVDISALPGFGRLGMHPKELEFDWAKLKVFKEITGVDQAVAAVQKAMADGHGWVYLYGSHGTAKSLIMKIAVALSIKSGKSAAYANMAKILGFMREAYDTQNPSGEAESRLDWLAGLEVLAIDEFDLISGTDWENNRRFQLMDERYNMAILQEPNVTLIASNRTPDQLPMWYADRIQDNRFAAVGLFGPSARRQMQSWDVG